MARDKAADKALGKAIQDLRKERRASEGNWTQDDLAALIGLKGTGRAVTISRLENGAIPITDKRLEKVAQALNVSPAEIDKRAAAHRLRTIDRRSDADATDVGLTGGFARGLLAVMGGPRAAANVERRQALEDKVAQRQRTTRDLFDPLREAQVDVVEEVLVPFVACSEAIRRKAPTVPRLEIDPEDLTLKERLHLHNEHTRYQVADTLGTSALGAGAGAVAGAGAAAAVMSLVAASATASTGVAIGSLSGAAASSATLAWLGGGSLAAGGLGVAGGTLLLASIVALPAAIAGAGVLAYQGRKMRDDAESDSRKLDLAEASLHDTDEALQRTWAWMRSERRILARLRKAGTKRLEDLENDLRNLSQPVVLEQTTQAFQDNYRDLTEIAATCVSVLGLSIFADLETEPSDNEDAAVRAEWIHLVLEDADEQAERLGGRDPAKPVKWPSTH